MGTIKVNVRCQVCGKVGNIEILQSIVKENSRGIYVIVIPENTICKDSFIAYIDNNFIVRDTVLTDFQVELPDVIIEKTVNDDILYAEKALDVDLIKLNLPPTLLTHMLKGIFSRKKIMLIFIQLVMFIF